MIVINLRVRNKKNNFKIFKTLFCSSTETALNVCNDVEIFMQLYGLMRLL